jgi:hypothetical protein
MNLDFKMLTALRSYIQLCQQHCEGGLHGVNCIEKLDSRFQQHYKVGRLVVKSIAKMCIVYDVKNNCEVDLTASKAFCS